MKNSIATIRLENNTAEVLRVRAENNGVSVADEIRAAINLYLAPENSIAALTNRVEDLLQNALVSHKKNTNAMTF